MTPENTRKLAEQFMLNAVKAKAGENIWIEFVGPEAKKLADVCGEVVRSAGAVPYFVDSSAASLDAALGSFAESDFNAYGLQKLEAMKKMQGYIRIRDDDDAEKSKLSEDQKRLYQIASRPMTDYRVNNTHWLVVETPTEAFAKACSMSMADFERFYLDVCLVNYQAMAEAALPLENLMRATKQVRIFAPKQNTDLTLSIEGIGAKMCCGECNIPDGECYSAPVLDSINGTITYGPSNYEGEKFASIHLTFEKGRIVKAEAENAERTARLNVFLDTDPGARSVGEFSLNFNPYIDDPTGSILFDEKINGGIHLAAGSSYDDVGNGNKSAIHWDMVHVQRPDCGGGEIWFDGRLIRKDGLFVLPELEALNPENLKKAS